MARRRNNSDFTRAFHEIGSAAQEAAKKALAEGAEIVMKDAESRVHSVSGDLAASIHAISQKNGTKIKIVADAKNENGVAYGQFVEFWPGREHPFMYPAMDANRDKVKEMVKEAIREGVRKNGNS